MSLIIVGHVLALKLPFANGSPCHSKRPFLVIDKKDDTLDLLNISSSRRKERKLLFPSNKKINNYNPPLDEPSFVKLDELYTIDYFDDLTKSIYKRRDPMDSTEVDSIIQEYLGYKQNNEVVNVKYIETKVRQENSL